MEVTPGDMKIIVRAKSYKDCEREVEKKIERGWGQASGIIEDKYYIGRSFVCIMQREINEDQKKKQFNKYCGW